MRKNIESSHKIFNELKRRFACIREEQKGESILKCFNLMFSDNVASAIEEIEESSSAPHGREKVQKQKHLRPNISFHFIIPTIWFK